MERVGLVYVSRKGQTAKIIDYLGRQLAKRNIATQIVNLGAGQSLEGKVDGLIIGAPVYAGAYPRALFAWTKKNPGLLRLPLAFFSVTLNAADKRPSARAADRKLLQLFVDRAGVRPRSLASFAGALKYRDYNWLLRLWMRRIAAEAGGDTDTSRNHEYTDWAAVDQFLEEFLAGRNQAQGIADSPLPRSKSKREWVNLGKGYPEERRI